MAKCKAGEGLGWTCKHPAEVGELCGGHYKQQVRSRPFTPLRKRADRQRLSGIRVSERAIAQLEAEAEAAHVALATVASDVIETWAARRERRLD